MTRKQYPVQGKWGLSDTNAYFLMAGQKATCGHVLGKKEKFWRRETQVSYMRGDDEVESRCLQCGPANGGPENEWAMEYCGQSDPKIPNQHCQCEKDHDGQHKSFSREWN